MKSKKPARRNPMARVVATTLFRQRTVPSGKLYKRRPKHRGE